ncbi:TRAP transporter small permease subunit [Marinobacter changyiensis]|uniref:TRAP transporter small permease subunit n=1 Tax=Marinobacter changyiensis TaxID=2604091 RepID=UPI0012649045|nr:TRAP transporter small permease subunit [Marinobacter changyiensis]
MRWLIAVDNGLGAISKACGWLASVAFILMMLNVFYDVLARYAFNEVSIGMQEMEWHLYSFVFLMGIPYAMRTDGHVRVDVWYAGRREAFKAWINLIGALLFALPIAALIAWLGWDYMIDSYQMGEGSGDPGGLPYRFIIKGLIPFSSFFLAVASLGMATFALRVLAKESTYEGQTGAGGLA